MLITARRQAVVALLTLLLIALGLAETVKHAPPAHATTISQLRVLTYNVRRDGALSDPTFPVGKLWRYRESFVVSIIRKNTPGLFGLQEVRADKFDANGVAMDDYLVGAFTNPPVGEIDYTAIVPPQLLPDTGVNHDANLRPNLMFAKVGKFALLNDGVVPFATISGLPADCDAQGDNFAWAVVRDTTTDPDNTMFVVNTHLTNDENGTDCSAQRENEVRQIHKAVNALDSSHYPVVLMGDLNVDNQTTSEATLEILGESASSEDGTQWDHWYNLDPTLPLTNDGPTFNSGWATDNDSQTDTQRVDYIWAGTKFSADLQLVDTFGYKYGGYTTNHSPSDHYPVFARLTLTP